MRGMVVTENPDDPIRRVDGMEFFQKLDELPAPMAVPDDPVDFPRHQVQSGQKRQGPQACQLGRDLRRPGAGHCHSGPAPAPCHHDQYQRGIVPAQGETKGRNAGDPSAPSGGKNGRACFLMDKRRRTAKGFKTIMESMGDEFFLKKGTG